MKQFTSIYDVENIELLLNKVKSVKNNPFLYKNIGNNKTIGLVFFQPSLRTRLSTQKAIFNIGANTWTLNINNDSWKIETHDGTIMEHTQEHLKEAISVMSLYCDILAVRVFPNLKDREYDYKETLLKKILKYSKVPVISLESATLHPLQSLSDILTIEELNPLKKKIKVVLTWAPHIKSLPQSVPNSFIQWASKIKYIDLFLTHPIGYELNKSFTKNVYITNNQEKAFNKADFIYAKSWSSFYYYGKMISKNLSWIINNDKMNLTNNAKFMHCLPIRRNVVAKDEVIDGNNSLILKQAENRIFATQTILLEILKHIIND